MIGLKPSGEISDQDKVQIELNECRGRSILTGISVGPIVFGSLYFGQEHFGKNFRGYSRRATLASSWFFCLGSAYLVWSHGIHDCEQRAMQKREAVKRKQANPLIS